MGIFNVLIFSDSQCPPKKRRSSLNASVFCPFCPKAYCRKDKLIDHIKKNHHGKCWHCFCDMRLVELGQVCQLCWQQFCCPKLLKHHKCAFCLHCKLKIPALERKLHVCKRTCPACDKLFLCLTARNNHLCPGGQPNSAIDTPMVPNIANPIGQNVLN